MKEEFLLGSLSKTSVGSRLFFIAYISSLVEAETKTGNTYYKGSLISGEVTNFISFDTPKFGGVSEGDIAVVEGEIGEYNGSRQLKLKKISKAEGKEYEGITKSDLLVSRYSKEELKTWLERFVSTLSDDGQKVFKLLVEPVKKRFYKEFAAVRHHDNTKNGLFAHSAKTALIMERIVDLYPSLTEREGTDKDLFMLGAFLHDIGKVEEYCDGEMSEIGALLSHRVLGLKYVYELRGNIVSIKGEEWYYRLLSVISQHHGEYEERPRTIEAYIVHLADSMDAAVTPLVDAINSDSLPFRADNSFYLS